VLKFYLESFNLCLIIVRHFACPSSILYELSIIFNFTVLHSISLFCTGEIALFTNLGLIDMFSANQSAEIVACILQTTVIYYATGIKIIFFFLKLKKHTTFTIDNEKMNVTCFCGRINGVSIEGL